MTVRHGYGLDDLHRLARHATMQSRGYFVGGFADHYEIAWMAIVEELCTREDVPTYPQLLRVGWQAIYSEVSATRHHYGYHDHSNVGTVHGAGSGPRFVAYWWDLSSSTPSCEERVVERLSLAQILPRLNPLHLQALMALAATGTFQAAARSSSACVLG